MSLVSAVVTLPLKMIGVSMHKKLHFWLYLGAAVWWGIELYAQNGPSGNAAVSTYQSLAGIDVMLPGNSLLPSAIPSGAAYLLIAGFIAHKKGH